LQAAEASQQLKKKKQKKRKSQHSTPRCLFPMTGLLGWQASDRIALAPPTLRYCK
jgi:hypothetical protein